MKSNCCQSPMTVQTDGNGSIGSTYYYVCLACLKACDSMSEPYKPLPMYKKKGLSDDEALAEGIRVQNNHYAKLLKFCQKVSQTVCFSVSNYVYLSNEAHDLLREIEG